MPPQPYVKTPAGTDEISARSGRLAPRLRRLLILVDGRRDTAELAALLDDDTVAGQLAALDAAGLIAQPSSPPVPPIADADPAAAAHPPPEPSPQQLERARALMSESAARHLGILGRPLLASIAGALDHGALRAVSAAWHMALRESRDGRAEADLLLHKLHELLGAD